MEALKIKTIYKFLIILTLINHCLFRNTDDRVFKFGKHNPNGIAAVNYMYSSDGFWKPLAEVNYDWNKFSSGNLHYVNTVQFGLHEAAGQFLICRDEEGHLLGDVDPMDGELDSNIDFGYAFHSHNGRTAANTAHATIKPSYVFLYNDNYLGRIIANNYATDIPFGLGVYTDKLLWSVLTKSNTNASYASIVILIT